MHMSHIYMSYMTIDLSQMLRKFKMWVIYDHWSSTRLFSQKFLGGNARRHSEPSFVAEMFIECIEMALRCGSCMNTCVRMCGGWTSSVVEIARAQFQRFLESFRIGNLDFVRISLGFPSNRERSWKVFQTGKQGDWDCERSINLNRRRSFKPSEIFEGRAVSRATRYWIDSWIDSIPQCGMHTVDFTHLQAV